MGRPHFQVRLGAFAKSDSPIQLASIKDARQYRIGGYKGDAKTQFLLDRGIEVQAALRDAENVRKLDKDQIDLLIASSQAGPLTAGQEGVDSLKVVQHLNSVDLYLALNLQPRMSWFRSCTVPRTHCGPRVH